jgi:hypothetical protein
MQNLGFILRNQENISNNLYQFPEITKEKEKIKRSTINALPTDAKTNSFNFSDYKTENNRITPTKYIPFWITDSEKKKNNIVLFNISPSEKYSLLKIKKLKENNKFSPFNSTTRIYQHNIQYYDFDTKENNINEYKYFSIMKRKKISSVKKYFESDISFQGKNKKIKHFKIFRDCEIGINDKWQKKQVSIFQDDDVNSDDEEILKGKQICIINIKEAITLFNKKNNKIK